MKEFRLTLSATSLHHSLLPSTPCSRSAPSGRPLPLQGSLLPSAPCCRSAPSGRPLLLPRSLLPSAPCSQSAPSERLLLLQRLLLLSAPCSQSTFYERPLPLQRSLFPSASLPPPFLAASTAVAICLVGFVRSAGSGCSVCWFCFVCFVCFVCPTLTITLYIICANIDTIVIIFCGTITPQFSTVGVLQSLITWLRESLCPTRDLWCCLATSSSLWDKFIPRVLHLRFSRSGTWQVNLTSCACQVALSPSPPAPLQITWQVTACQVNLSSQLAWWTP